MLRHTQQERKVEFVLLGCAAEGGGGGVTGGEAPTEAAGGTRRSARRCDPDSNNIMELENIVANTVLLKAREGEDGDGGLTAPLPR